MQLDPSLVPDSANHLCLEGYIGTINSLYPLGKISKFSMQGVTLRGIPTQGEIVSCSCPAGESTGPWAACYLWSRVIDLVIFTHQLYFGLAHAQLVLSCWTRFMALNYCVVFSKLDVAFMTTTGGYCINRERGRGNHTVTVREVVKPFKEFEALRKCAFIVI